MTTTEKEKVTHCGFCLQEFAFSEFTQHGINICNSSTEPINIAGSEVLELYFEQITGGDEWLDIQEALAAEMSTDYAEISEQLAEGGELTAKAEDRMWQIDDRAAHAMTINFVKRLMFATGIKIEDLLS